MSATREAPRGGGFCTPAKAKADAEFRFYLLYDKVYRTDILAYVCRCCRGNGDEAMRIMRRMMGQLKLTVNEGKTRLRRIPEESVEFLGYTIGRCYSSKTGRAYIGTRPSKQSLRRITRQVSELTARRMVLLDAEKMVRRLNRLLTGWGNYFCLGPVSKAYRAVDAHTRHRLRQWLCHKHKLKGQGTGRYPDEYLEDDLQLVTLALRTRDLPWAKV